MGEFNRNGGGGLGEVLHGLIGAIEWKAMVGKSRDW